MATLLSTPSLIATSYDLYFGTYTNASPSEGIYHSTFDSETAVLSKPELAAKVSNPTFVAIHPNNKIIYTVSERNPGEVSAFAIEKNKQLKLINKAFSGGIGPCHLSLSVDAKTLLVANYSSGTLSSIPIKVDGSLGIPASQIKHKGSSINKKRQEAPHAHSINISPDNKFAYVADLGIDKIMIYNLDPKTSKLTTNNPPYFATKPGAGPRHLTFHPNGKFVYLINELDNTLISLSYNSTNGELKEIQSISTLPSGFKGDSKTAEVNVHPNGKFLYASNRGYDSIASYAINSDTGILTFVSFQKHEIDNPRHFNLDPSGKFCIVGSQDTNQISLFKINQKTGELIPTETKYTIGKPVCIKFLKKWVLLILNVEQASCLFIFELHLFNATDVSKR